MKHLNNQKHFFLKAKYHTFLELLDRGWSPHDLVLEGGPDFIATKGKKMVRFKLRYATKNDTGYVFSVGGDQSKTFSELTEDSDCLIFVCLEEKESRQGFYVFSKKHIPKIKTFFHPFTGPFPKYEEFYGNWDVLDAPLETMG